MANVNLGCSQQDFYTGGRMVWANYAERQLDFEEYSGIYTLDYGVQRVSELNAAERLLDRAAREAIATAIFRELGACNKNLMYQYLLLRSYLPRIYDASVMDLKLSAIGDGYYNKANGGSWGDTSALIGQVIPFWEDNQAELMAKNIIPAAFPNKLTSSAKAFSDKYTGYTAANKNVDTAKDEKDNANSTALDYIKDINRVAQIIYNDDPKSAALFVWSTVVAQTHGVRNAGVGGKVTDEVTKKTISGVLMQIKNGDKSAVTADKTGRFEITPLSSGNYVLIVSKEGYETQEIKFKVTTGVTTRVNVVLKRLATT